jgi:hypothetical protein
MDKMFPPHTIALCDCDLCFARHAAVSNESACLSMSLPDDLTRGDEAACLYAL